MLRLLFFLFALGVFLVPSVTWADDANSSGTGQSSATRTGNGNGGIKEPPSPPDRWWGLRVGGGIGFTRTFGRDRIETAFSDNGIVRIDGEKNAIPRLMLDIHKLHSKEYWASILCDEIDVDESRAKLVFGPFFAFQPGTNEIIQSVTGGFMVGIPNRRASGDKYAPVVDSLNIGFGISVEPNSKTLGDGLQVNQPVPSGMTVRTQTRSLVGVTIMISAGF